MGPGANRRNILVKKRNNMSIMLQQKMCIFCQLKMYKNVCLFISALFKYWKQWWNTDILLYYNIICSRACMWLLSRSLPLLRSHTQAYMTIPLLWLCRTICSRKELWQKCWNDYVTAEVSKDSSQLMNLQINTRCSTLQRWAFTHSWPVSCSSFSQVLLLVWILWSPL